MTFDAYWAENFKTTEQPAVFDLALREIAETAWNAAIAEAVIECNAYGDRNFDICQGAYGCAEIIQDLLGNTK